MNHSTGSGQNENVLMTPTHHRIMAIIKEHKGRKNAIGYREIAKMVERHPRRVRQYVSELINQFGEPIGSCYAGSGGGYYLITSAWEVEETANKLRGHGIAMLKRAADLRGISYADLLGQLRLDAPAGGGV